MFVLVALWGLPAIVGAIYVLTHPDWESHRYGSHLRRMMHGPVVLRRGADVPRRQIDVEAAIFLLFVGIFLVVFGVWATVQ